MSLQLRPGVVTQVIDGQMLLLDSRGGQYFDLNASGTAMLQALLAGSGRAALLETLAQRHAVAPARLDADLSQLLVALRAAGLIEGEPPA
ncbi:MAG: PqqD family peptide modification chaperone [Lysobacterales bacterium]